VNRSQPHDPVRPARRVARLRRSSGSLPGRRTPVLGGTLRRGDRGVSSIELVLFMPLLFFAIFVTVQFGFVYLGNSAVSSAARESARIARSGGTDAAARARGEQILSTVGHGLIEGNGGTITIDRRTVGGVDDSVSVTVRARAVRVVPGLPAVNLEQVVAGPLEEFRGDPGGP
jgi:Flp pilus assembly protein TadG